MGYFTWNWGKVVWTCSIFCLFSVLIASVGAQILPEDLIVNAGPLGTLRGVKQVTARYEREYIRFSGIPYAKAPVGSNRFLPAEPAVIPLTDDGSVFDATKTTACCPQPGSYLVCILNQKEDCLGVTVFTPTPPRLNATKLPVLVFIHGGGFSTGSGSIYTGARILEERDVVLVTFNYRLGALGFFCLNTEDAPGNAAMYDMVEALKWIKAYIGHFGGDPERITIAGQSAGSAAVSHLMTSPLTRNAGLFHRAIGMSGTVLNEWGTTTSEKAEKASLEIAEMVQCYDSNNPIYDPEEIVQCMQNVSTSELVSKLDQYQVKENNFGRLGFEPVTPTIQRIAPRNGDIFLGENPEEILKRQDEAKVPLLTGSTKHDASFVLALVYDRYLRANGHLTDENFLKRDLVPALLSALGIEDKTEAVFDSLSNTYLGKEVRDSGNMTVMIPPLTDMFTVFFFKAAIFRTLKLHSRHQPQSYWYSFDYRGRNSNYKSLIPDPSNTIPIRGGVTHSDELIYLFSIPGQILNSTLPDEIGVSKRLVDYFVNFAYSGNPNTEEIETGNGSTTPQADTWPAFSEESPYFAILDTEDKFIADYPNDYWLRASEELYPELFPGLGDVTSTETNAENSTENSTDNTTDGGEGGPATTPAGSPISQQSSVVLLFVAALLCFFQAAR